MSVSSDTCRGDVAMRLVSEDARVQGYSKSSLICETVVIASSLRDQNLDQSKLIIKI